MDRLAKIPIGGQEADASQTVRLKVSVGGVVQGVGFRPFVYRLAQLHELTGYVLNNPAGVEIEVQGSLAGVSGFLSGIVDEKPPQARVDSLAAYFVDLAHDDRFVIKDSRRSSGRTTLISPDIATCEDCLAELESEQDRRHAYPFINCTNCGPRYTIIKDIPYDREKTTMTAFKMCGECLAEYGDPVNRRFHAEPNACWVCGPRVILRDPAGEVIECDDPIAEGRAALRAGKTVAVKGLGGFHLAVDATSEGAVARLRARKLREEKPLAVMAKDIASIRMFAEVGRHEEEVLLSPARPIVLLRKLAACPIAESVAPGNRNLGVMLPYTPIHHLLLADAPCALVMTSGNISEEPIAIDIGDAVERLGDIVDVYLDHNREILSRCDDSVVRVLDGETLFLRRSRGWVPLPIHIASSRESILACGAHLKNTIALTRGNQVFLSQHVGDLENLPAFEFFKSTVDQLQKVIAVEPEVVAYDLHPDYLSTKFALKLSVPRRIAVQHHHAHIASCLGEAGIDGPVIGMALDGTGYGPDATIWGCEVLMATRRSYERMAHLEHVGMPGGEKAVREPWRMALSHLRNAFGEDLKKLDLPELLRQDAKPIDILLRMLDKGVNCPVTSSCGRLFDTVSCLCGVRDKVSYEGQAAIELEMAAEEGEAAPYTVAVETVDDMITITTKALIREIVDDLRNGKERGKVSARFHSWLAASLLEVAVMLRERHGTRTVALSGGCFQNEILLRLLRDRLTDRGFDVIINRQVPANDGGICFGQVVVAAATLADD